MAGYNIQYSAYSTVYAALKYFLLKIYKIVYLFFPLKIYANLKGLM